MLVRAYLRASTDEQDADRARGQLETFVAERGLTVVAWYTEHDSGARLVRPELFRLLSDALPGDMLLVEQVDRLSRLSEGDWAKLKDIIAARQIRVVALDVPTSWMMADPKADEFTSRLFSAVNAMILDILAAVARKDHQDRIRRTAQGRARALAEGRYRGRPENKKRNDGIVEMLRKGASWSNVQAATGCSRATIAKLAKRCRASAVEPLAFNQPSTPAQSQF